MIFVFGFDNPCFSVVTAAFVDLLICEQIGATLP